MLARASRSLDFLLAFRGVHERDALASREEIFFGIKKPFKFYKSLAKLKWH